MTDSTDAGLPWEQLHRTDGELPWEALEQLAEAACEEEAVLRRVQNTFEEAAAIVAEQETYADLYCLGVVSLAAPQMDDATRDRVAEWLVARLVEAGQADDLLQLEALTAACGRMGAKIVPHALNVLQQAGPEMECWCNLWDLLKLVTESADDRLRVAVQGRAHRALSRAEEGELSTWDLIPVAYLLAELGDVDSAPRLRRLAKKSPTLLGGGNDLREAADQLEGKLDYEPLPPEWERPVREEIEARVRRAWKGFHPEGEHEAAIDQAREMAHAFAESERAAELPEDAREEAGSMAFQILEYAWDYLRVGPRQLDREGLDEVLLEVFPRKMTAERDYFERLAPVAACLLRWLEQEGLLAEGGRLAETVEGWAEKIVSRAMDPEWWGPAKETTMSAMAAGVDIHDERAMIKSLEEENRRLFRERRRLQAGLEQLAGPPPIVNPNTKVGRNDPCPCGSGRKYKRCCGKRA